jgi:DNA-binding CsgD family transcriptional regulator
LLQLATYELAVGSLAAAEGYFAGQHEVLTLLGFSDWNEVTNFVALAWRGHEPELRAALSPFMVDAARRGLGHCMRRAGWALVILELSLGNYEAAVAAIPRGWQDDLAVGAFIASDAIEAHVRAGDLRTAQDALDWLTQRAETNRTPLELGLLHRSRALVAQPGEAEAEFTQAIELLEGNAAAQHVGRAHLVYGEWLRRQRRRTDARRELEAAFEIFSSIGTGAFAERARLELLATGATTRKRVAETRTDLSPQEDRVARMAADGATNAEIATALFVSRYTVDYHLRNVYTKLGLTSRRQLAGALS